MYLILFIHYCDNKKQNKVRVISISLTPTIVQSVQWKIQMPNTLHYPG